MSNDYLTALNMVHLMSELEVQFLEQEIKLFL